MEREELVLRRIEYLREIARRAENASAGVLVAGLLSPVLSRLAPLAAAAFLAVLAVAAAAALIVAYMARLEIERLWGKLLGRDPRLLALPVLPLVALLVVLGLLLALTS